MSMAGRTEKSGWPAYLYPKGRHAMKKVFAVLLAALLMLTGCVNKEEDKNVSVTDALCPYKIGHKEGALEITLQNGAKNGLTWQVTAMPDDVCQITQKDSEDADTALYSVKGVVEGAVQLTFTGAQEDQTVGFVLTVVANINANKEVNLASYQHRERNQTAVEADGLNYKWDVDVNGVLNFTFKESEDQWSVQCDDSEVCKFVNQLSTPSGCNFSVEAVSPGQVTVELLGETSQRKINVVLQVDNAGKLEVISVQEQ